MKVRRPRAGLWKGRAGRRAGGKGHIWLRNRIVEHLNNWEMLGCHMIAGDRFFLRNGNSKIRGFSRLAFGVAKDGRAILIYPIKNHRKRIPRHVCELMETWEIYGAIVGCAMDVSDAWDCTIDNPAEYKRKQRTYLYKRMLEFYRRSTNDESE